MLRHVQIFLPHEGFAYAVIFGWAGGDAFLLMILQKLAILVYPILTYYLVGIIGLPTVNSGA